ncbi:recombinase family protein [Mameliella alba]|uniref:recombinase family protein n=1 Tax=Mameliella alba TaxID=561184 RepID=UPI0014310584|nr:recombinase family protein [Mameliella alba]
MKPCFGYIRVSTQKQGLGVSLEAQQEAITRFASQHNLDVIRWFEEKETAAKRGRPIFNHMLRQLKRGKAAGLIMHKIDRSARNLRDWALVSELPSQGIDIFFATETLDFQSRGGRLAANLQAVIAEDYIHNLREETIKGLAGRLKQGLYPFRAPIGYVDNGRGKPKSPCPIKAPLVRQAFDLYASRQHSLRTLLAEMHRLGLRNHDNKPLSLHGLETILNNPFYTGTIVIKRTRAVYQGQHKAIVPTRLFQRVQEIKTGKSGKKVTRHNHLYRGLFRCGLCSGPMSPERQKARVYYRCQQSSCPTTTVREDSIDEAVTAELERWQLADADVARLFKQWRAELDSGEPEKLLASYELQIAQLNAKLDRLMDLLLDGTIGQDDYNARRLKLRFDIESLEEATRELGESRITEAQAADLLELLKSLTQLHILGNSATKRRIVENCFSNRTVAGKNLCLEPYNWLQKAKFSELSPLVTQNDTLIELLRGDRRSEGDDLDEAA